VKYIAAYVSAAVVMAALDAVWLTTVGPRLYRPHLGPILMDSGFRLAPAIAFYVLYVVGITIFATAPALKSGQWTTAALYGALFGFFCYATYDLTSQATLKVWSTTVTVVDIAWGTLLTCVTATAAFLVTRKFFG